MTIVEHEVATEEWREFCESFSRQHHGWLVNIELREPATAPRELAHHLPLQEIREAHGGASGTLMVTVGAGTDETSFLIENVTRVYERNLDGAHQGLRICTSREATTLVEFRAASSPDDLDDIAQSEMEGKD